MKAQSAADPQAVHPITLPAMAVGSTPAPEAPRSAASPDDIPAERVHRITLPVAPKAATDAPATRPAAPADDVPAERVRPITSLPKPVDGPSLNGAAVGALLAPTVLPSTAPSGMADFLPPAVPAESQPVHVTLNVPSSAASSVPSGTPGIDSGIGIQASVLARFGAARPVLKAAEAPAPVSLGEPALRASLLSPPNPLEAMIARRLPPMHPVPHVRPFRALAVQLRGGSPGVGADVSIPLLERLNVRAGYSFLKVGGDVTLDGMYLNGAVHFNTTTVSLDLFPLNNEWRVSAGLALYRGNTISAGVLVPAAQTFTLNEVTLESSPVDPVHGSAVLSFGMQKAPMLTIGRGNLLPRHGGHLSMPFEAGVQYVQRPALTLALTGTACANANGVGACTTFQNDPSLQADLAGEQANLNYALRSVRVIPVVSIGLGWSFTIGRHTSAIR